ncbi:MAG: SBBP repeat-containing protein [Thermoplasmata archaeon]|nr:MAG: SBBP repeat-containing protein [Thermoplasmata archaeon]
MGKNSRRTVLTSIVLMILLTVQIAPFWEPIYDDVTFNSALTKTTETEVNDFAFDKSDLSELEKIPVVQNEYLHSAFDIPEMDGGYFTENLGQWEDHIHFLAQSSFGYVGLGNDKVFYYLVQEKNCHVITVSFHNADGTNPVGGRDAGFDSNYFYGNDQTKWITEARSFKEVLYENVWPGIDILYYFKNKDLKYDIIVGENSEPKDISITIEGHTGLNIQEDELEIFVSDGVLLSDKDLVAFYEDGETTPIQFKKFNDNTYGFTVEKIDGRVLTIDPFVLSTSTFFGGSSSDSARDVAVDGSNNIIILGDSYSEDFPNTTGAYQNYNAGAGDIVITKMNHNASELIFSTYIGDWGGDIPKGIEVDDNGDIYVAGTTWAWNFPTTLGAFQESDPSGTYPDVIVFKLSAQGSDLLYSTYVGGTQSDGAYDIKVKDYNAYIVGNTLSYDFPTVGPPVGDPHGTVLFFILNNEGSRLLNSAFWGGLNNEFGYSIAIDSNGDVVVGGGSSSMDFPTTSGAYQETVNDLSNGFVLKYRPSTNETVFSTFIGGDAGENVISVNVDEENYIYFTGTTGNPGEEMIPYPTTPGAFDRTINGNRDAFITKMDPNGTMLIYSTFIGSDGLEEVGRIDVDCEGKVILTGSIDSDVNFTVTPNCFDDSYNGEEDAIVVILNSDGSDLIYSSFLGGNESDKGFVCFLRDSNELLVLGMAVSLDFPVTYGAYQTENKGYGDIFLTIFSIGNYTFLHNGWNLISIPMIQQNTNLGVVLSSISGYYDAIQWYDASATLDPWKHHQISKPFNLNDLNDIEHKMGFWIHITKPGGVLFEYLGTHPTENQMITLYPGWNMVGYPSLTNYNITEGLNKLTFSTDVDAIITYNAAAQRWERLGESDYFQIGKGYYIHAKSEYVWEVPFE